MSELERSGSISILFRNHLGGVDRVTVTSDREAQRVINERASLGETRERFRT